MNRLLTIANLVTAAHELTLQEIEQLKVPPGDEVKWLERTLQLALSDARRAAGLNPPPPLPAPSKTPRRRK